MGHYAKVKDGIVTKVIVADESFFQMFIDDEPGTWIKTSYNTRGGVHRGEDGKPDNGEPFRKNYAGIGYTYDSLLDAFIPPKPYNSWLLNESTCLWEAPVPKPEDGFYDWDEANQQWIKINYEVQQ